MKAKQAGPAHRTLRIAALMLPLLITSGCGAQPDTAEAGRTSKPQSSPQSASDPGPGTFIEFSPKEKQFVMRNASDKPIWFDGYSQYSPLLHVERLTSDGWIESRFDWCGTGVKRHVLPPGKTITFGARLEAMPFNLCTDIAVLEKYPGIDRLPVRVGAYIFREQKAEEGRWVWSGTIESPPK